MTDTILSDFRAEMQKILTRYRDGHESIAPVRISTIKAASARMDYLEERVAACRCDEVSAFEIDGREKRGDVAFAFARLSRMGSEDAMNGPGQ